MRIALVVAPMWSTITPSLGTATLAGALIRASQDVRVFDFNGTSHSNSSVSVRELWSPRLTNLWMDQAAFSNFVLPHLESQFNKLIEELVAWKPDVIGCSIYVTSFFCSIEIVKRIRQMLPNVKVVFGGPTIHRLHLEVSTKHYDGVVDAAVVGEGEETLVELLHFWREQRSLNDCKGLAFLDDAGTWVFSSPRQMMTATSFPSPDFSDIDLKTYSPSILPIMMSRGCVAKCTFCSETRFWKTYRNRGAEKVFEEMKESHFRYGVVEFEFNDSLINGDFRQLENLVDLLIESRLDLVWRGFARLDSRLNGDFLTKMKRAGCKILRYGFESGSQKIVDLMEKRTTVTKAKQIIRDTWHAGISTHLQIIVGFPGETEEDFQMTLDFINECAQYIGSAFPSTLVITPELPLSQNPEKYQIRTDIDFLGSNWVSLDGLNNPMVRQERLNRVVNLLAQHNISTF